MRYFAKVDERNIVSKVIVAPDNIEELAEEAYKMFPGEWWETWIDGGKRIHYAGVGYTYDPRLDVFIPPSPYPSWTLTAGYLWEPPVPMPEPGRYMWNENDQQWDAQS